MLLTIVVALLVLYLANKWLTRNRIKLPDVPGIDASPWWQLIIPVDFSKTHVMINDLIKKYGPVTKIPFIDGNDMVILADYESIYQVLVTDGKKFGGRVCTYRSDLITNGTGILQNHKPDATWKALRKTSQRHLRQFGDGLSRLETIIVDIAEDMFSAFQENVEKPYDPQRVIFDTALNSISFLMIGRRTRTGDRTLEQMREYERLFLDTLSGRMKFMILDVLPWLRHLGWPTFKYFKRTLELEADIWNEAKEYAVENPDAESICQVFMDQIADGDTNLTETDASKATLSLLLAGVASTSNVFYATINIIAHYKRTQDAIYSEIQKIQENTGRIVGLQDRPDMPYTRAVLLEMLRYTSVASLGVMHKTLEDGNVKGYKIPAGTFIITALYTLHHDEAFWEDPYTFNPERFLDDNGDLVPADHPNRKHLMPFGAGTRVCLGESLAMTRLFLWLVSLVQKFEVSPAEGNDKSSTDTRQFNYDVVLRSKPYEVIFEKRKA